MQRSFGEQLKSIRLERGLVQKQLGDSAGVGQAAIANYEKGVRFPGEDTLRRLSRVLEVPLDELFGMKPIAPVHRRKSPAQQTDRGFSETEFISVLLNESLDTARSFLSRCLPADGGIDELYCRILTPLLQTVGRLWLQGELTVAQEHIVSMKIRQLIVLFGAEPDQTIRDRQAPSPLWLGFTAPGDEHDMSLLMLSRMMAHRGWRSVFIGMAPPLPDLIKSVESYRPDVIVVSLTIGGLWNSLETWIRSILARMKDGSRIIVGGFGIQYHRDALARLGVLTADSLAESVQMAERIGREEL